MTRTVLLIIGMHRAGTSALARVCSLRGAALPRDVLPANAGNTSGYWEPKGVTELNERILDYFDLAWDNPFASDLLPPPEEMPAQFRDDARRVLEQEYGSADLFVLKDPRCTLLQAFWRQALESLGIRVCPVVVMRPWAEVIDSLVRRDSTDATSGALLYVAYGLEAAKAASLSASFVTYRQLMDDWRTTTDRVAMEQGVVWPTVDTDAFGEIEMFLQPVTKQTRVYGLPATLQSWAEATWKWFHDAANGRMIPRETLEPIAVELTRLGALFGPLLQDRKRLLRESEALQDAMRHERDAALQIYRDTDQRLRDMHQAYEEQIAENAVLLRDMHSSYEVQLAETDMQLRKTQADYVQRDEDYLVAKREAEALHGDLEASRGDLATVRSELAQVLVSRSWKLTAPLRYLMRIWHDRHTVARVEPRASASLPVPVRRAAPENRQHAGLRNFLNDEFGEATTRDVIARIDRYRLPVPTQEARAAIEVECEESQAIAWSIEIASRPARAIASDLQPDVSIVIPVYNQVPFTLACIDALMQHDSRYWFEILIGDDSSSDATAAALAVPLAGVRQIRHATNLGFVRNCNATAAHARGRYLVFLNNDTQVLPGWLDELIDTLDDNPDIGLAGSKLIYPDGKLQECGAIVWRDGSAWNHGRLGDPRRPEFSYLRDADYVSGASIALASTVWEQLGGFDEVFVPAYAEDADLAFRVRSIGLRTVVQPLSQVLHFEGISSGTDLGVGAKTYQVENLRKLRDRWAHVLDGHRANADQPELEKERAVTRRALFVDHCTPSPNEDAGSLVAFEIMQAFIAYGYKITFIPEDNFAHMGAQTRDLQRLGIEAIYHPFYSRMPAFLGARRDRYDTIFLHRFGVADAHMAALRRAYPDAKVIFLNADLYFLRQMRQAELDGDEEALARSRLTRARELRAIAAADVALVHSDHEQALLQQALPDANIILFPLIHDPAQQVPGPALREGVCFVGGFRHPPNADGIRWFVDAVWPRVLDAMPLAQLYIVGSHVTAEVEALADIRGVKVIGFVEDLDSFLDQRRLTVAPLRYGAGAKGKVAASLAQGVPVVCTPVAAEGMGLEPGVNVLVGVTPEALAQHVLALLVDDECWQRLSVAGLAYARDVTSRARAHQRIRDLLDPGAIADKAGV